MDSSALASCDDTSRLVSAPRRLVSWALAAVMLLPHFSCTRNHYRNQADSEAYQLIQEKARDPHWDLPAFQLEVDPASRMFDPFNPDRQPMPPDDPAAHNYMHVVDGKKGYPHWHAHGNVPIVENPEWMAYLPFDKDGVLVLNGDLAVQLAMLHSPLYQQQLEELYLSALDVSAERFRFDVQWWGGYETLYTHDAKRRQSGAPGLEVPGDSSSRLLIGTSSTGALPYVTNVGFTRAMTTGAEFAIGFANSFLWEFSGPSRLEMAYTPIAFSLFQPLLREAGRARIMESLTLSERRLLANVRQMERFRRGFQVEVMTGGPSTPGPLRTGPVPSVPLGPAPSGGWMGLLQTHMEIANLEDNIVRLRDNLLRLEETLQEMLTTIPDTAEEIPRQRLQVAQARQALFGAESRLLSARAAFQQDLDLFKLELGLPPHICVRIDDPMLDQFQLIDPTAKERQDEIDRLRQRAGRINIDILTAAVDVEDPVTGFIERALDWSEALEAQLRNLQQEFAEVAGIIERLQTENVARVREDVEQLQETLPQRQQETARLQRLLEEKADELCPLLPVPMIDPVIFDVAEIERLPEELQQSILLREEEFQVLVLEAELVQESIDDIIATAVQDEPAPRELYARIRDEVIIRGQTVLTTLADSVLSLQLAQTRARIESITLVPVELTAGEALEIARMYRRDWMNERAALVDQWRVIEFTADALESSLDVVFNGDISNVGNNPLDIRSSTGRLQVGLRFDAPFTRLLERNAYRQSLIEYQQARRNYYTFVDSVSTGLRSTLRTMERNQLDFELLRHAVRVAAEQIDLNEDIRKIREAAGQSAGPTAARDTVSALSDVLSAQNDILGVWVNYEVLRRRLDLDLGTMELDYDGRWIDPGPIGGQFGLSLPPLPMQPKEWPPIAEDELPADVLPADALPADSLPPAEMLEGLELLPPGPSVPSTLLQPPSVGDPIRSTRRDQPTLEAASVDYGWHPIEADDAAGNAVSPLYIETFVQDAATQPPPTMSRRPVPAIRIDDRGSSDF